MALSASRACDALIGTDDRAAARDTVDRRPDQEHLVKWCDDEIGVVGRPQTQVDRRPHRLQEVGLLLAAQLHMRIPEVVGVLGEERRDDPVLEVAIQLIAADEL